MKVILFTLLLSIFFPEPLLAVEGVLKKEFNNAVNDLRKQLRSSKYAPNSLSPFKVSDFLNKKGKKILESFLDDPLRNKSLESYKLVGLVWETKVPKAIIKDSSGKTHLLKKGDYLGDSQGQIIHIREGEVVVLELMEKEDGQGVVYKTSVLTFSELLIEKKKTRTGER